MRAEGKRPVYNLPKEALHPLAAVPRYVPAQSIQAGMVKVTERALLHPHLHPGQKATGSSV